MIDTLPGRVLRYGAAVAAWMFAAGRANGSSSDGDEPRGGPARKANPPQRIVVRYYDGPGEVFQLGDPADVRAAWDWLQPGPRVDGRDHRRRRGQTLTSWAVSLGPGICRGKISVLWPCHPRGKPLPELGRDEGSPRRPLTSRRDSRAWHAGDDWQTPKRGIVEVSPAPVDPHGWHRQSTDAGMGVRHDGRKRQRVSAVSVDFPGPRKCARIKGGANAGGPRKLRGANAGGPRELRGARMREVLRELRERECGRSARIEGSTNAGGPRKLRDANAGGPRKLRGARMREVRAN